MLFDTDLAGICFHTSTEPGLSARASQRSLELTALSTLRVRSTLSPCAAVILEFGTEEQEPAPPPRPLEEQSCWMQFLSEPSGSSWLGRLPRHVRDGEQSIAATGPKVWAWWCKLGAVSRPDQLGPAKAPRPDCIHAQSGPQRRGPPASRSEQRLAGVPAKFMTPISCPDTDRVRSRRRVSGGHQLDVHERMFYNSSS